MGTGPALVLAHPPAARDPFDDPRDRTQGIFVNFRPGCEPSRPPPRRCNASPTRSTNTYTSASSPAPPLRPAEIINYRSMEPHPHSSARPWRSAPSWRLGLDVGWRSVPAPTAGIWPCSRPGLYPASAGVGGWPGQSSIAGCSSGTVVGVPLGIRPRDAVPVTLFANEIHAVRRRPSPGCRCLIAVGASCSPMWWRAIRDAWPHAHPRHPPAGPSDATPGLTQSGCPGLLRLGGSGRDDPARKRRRRPGRRSRSPSLPRIRADV